MAALILGWPRMGAPLTLIKVPSPLIWQTGIRGDRS
jgi:hypothetical protein